MYPYTSIYVYIYVEGQ